eukprot:110794-Chlamydomonas_euryale.AAC.6
MNIPAKRHQSNKAVLIRPPTGIQVVENCACAHACNLPRHEAGPGTPAAGPPASTWPTRQHLVHVSSAVGQAARTS